MGATLSPPICKCIPLNVSNVFHFFLKQRAIFFFFSKTCRSSIFSEKIFFFFLFFFLPLQFHSQKQSIDGCNLPPFGNYYKVMTYFGTDPPIPLIRCDRIRPHGEELSSIMSMSNSISEMGHCLFIPRTPLMKSK